MRAALLLLLAGCATTAHWPYRGELLCVQNPTPARVRFVQQDAIGRTLAFGLPTNPGHRTCARWGFIANRGRFGRVDARGDTTWGGWFDPWAKP